MCYSCVVSQGGPWGDIGGDIEHGPGRHLNRYCAAKHCVRLGSLHSIVVCVCMGTWICSWDSPFRSEAALWPTFCGGLGGMCNVTTNHVCP